jgi:copper chaperone CopZ
VHSGWFYHATAIVLLIVLAFSYWPKGRGEKVKEEEPGMDRGAVGVPSPERHELFVKGMTCSHCVESVKRALTECPGVQSVDVDLALGRAIVKGERLDRNLLVAAVTGLGYKVKTPGETA